MTIRVLAVVAAAVLALAGCGNECNPDCDGKQCGSDGCGGFCGTCAQTRVCNAQGQCECAVRCADNNCWAPGTNCQTLGKCEQDTQCKACAGTDTPSCCDGLYVCCEADAPYACTNKRCYKQEANCPTDLCDALTPNSCPIR